MLEQPLPLADIANPDFNRKPLVSASNSLLFDVVGGVGIIN